MTAVKRLEVAKIEGAGLKRIAADNLGKAVKRNPKIKRILPDDGQADAHAGSAVGKKIFS